MADTEPEVYESPDPVGEAAAVVQVAAASTVSIDTWAHGCSHSLRVQLTAKRDAIAICRGRMLMLESLMLPTLLSTL